MIHHAKSWTLNQLDCLVAVFLFVCFGFLKTNFFQFLFHTQLHSRYKAEMKLGRKKKNLHNLKDRQHMLEEKIEGCSKDVILVFPYIVTVVKSCISTRIKQFSGIQMTMLKLLICVSSGRCSSPLLAFTNLNDFSSTL